MSEGVKSFNRQTEIDILKGIGIILVVWGHCGAPFHNFIYLFHMSLFFMASGFCFKNTNVINCSSMKKYVIRKLRTLYVPFVGYNSILVIFCNILIMLSLVDMTYLSFTSQIKSLLKVFLFFSFSDLSGATWFIRILFFVSIVYLIIAFLSSKIKKYGVLLHAVVILTCLLFAQLFSNKASIPDCFYYFIPFFPSYIAFVLGKTERVIFEKNKNRYSNIGCMITFCVSFLGLFVLNFFGNIELSRGYINNCLFYLFASLFGWHMVFSFSMIIRKTKIGLWVQALGKHTMWILLLHFLAFKIVTLFYIIITNQDISKLAVHPVLGDNGFLWILYLIVGIAIPLCLELLIIEIKKHINRLIN